MDRPDSMPIAIAEKCWWMRNEHLYRGGSTKGERFEVRLGPSMLEWMGPRLAEVGRIRTLLGVPFRVVEEPPVLLNVVEILYFTNAGGSRLALSEIVVRARGWAGERLECI